MNRKDKKGISEVFTIVLILLFTIILIFLVWQVVVPRIRGGLEKTEIVECAGESFTIESISGTSAIIKRETGIADLVKFKFSDGTTTGTGEAVATITAGMRGTFDLGFTPATGETLTVSPVFNTSEGNEITCTAFQKKV